MDDAELRRQIAILSSRLDAHQRRQTSFHDGPPGSRGRGRGRGRGHSTWVRPATAAAPATAVRRSVPPKPMSTALPTRTAAPAPPPVQPKQPGTSLHRVLIVDNKASADKTASVSCAPSSTAAGATHAASQNRVLVVANATAPSHDGAAKGSRSGPPAPAQPAVRSLPRKASIACAGAHCVPSRHKKLILTAKHSSCASNSATATPSKSPRRRLLSGTKAKSTRTPLRKSLTNTTRTAHRSMVFVGGSAYRQTSRQLVRTTAPHAVGTSASTSTNTSTSTRVRTRTPVKGTVARTPSTILRTRSPLFSASSRVRSLTSKPLSIRSQVAHRVLKRSLTTARAKKYCTFFNRSGECKRGSVCPYVHDRTRIAVCPLFLKGHCDKNDTCLLSHVRDPQKMPACQFFLKGRCTVDKCPFRHVKTSASAAACDAFLAGNCPLGDRCFKAHVRPSKEASSGPASSLTLKRKHTADVDDTAASASASAHGDEQHASTPNTATVAAPLAMREPLSFKRMRLNRSGQTL